MSVIRSTIKDEYEAELAQTRSTLETLKSLPPPTKRDLGNQANNEQPRHQEDDYDTHYKLIRLGKGRGYHIVPKIALPAPNLTLTVDDLLTSFAEKSSLWRSSETRKAIMNKIDPAGFDLALCCNTTTSFSRGKAEGELAMMNFAAFMDIATRMSKGNVQVVFQQPDYVFTKLDLEFLHLLDVTIREIGCSVAVNEQLPPPPDAKRVFLFGPLPPAIFQMEKEKTPLMILTPQIIDDRSIRPRTVYAEARKSSSEAAKALWECCKAAEERVKLLRPKLEEAYHHVKLHPLDEQGREQPDKWFTLLWKKQAPHHLSKKEGKRAVR